MSDLQDVILVVVERWWGRTEITAEAVKQIADTARRWYAEQEQVEQASHKYPKDLES